MFWYPLARDVRVTFYHPSYTTADTTAKGEAYSPCAAKAALGPSLLAEARAITGQDWPIIRLTDQTTGRVQIFQVNDTGSPALEIDLPYCTWAYCFGYPHTMGVFFAIVEVAQDVR